MACVSCQNQKALLNCAACAAPLCKGCAQFIDQDTFAFWPALPSGLVLEAYCPSCYQAQVMPHIERYSQIMEKARDVNVFFKAQSKESRFIRRLEKPIRVEDCADRDEVVLKLAFIAAEAGFNVLLDVEANARKIKNGKWQTSLWSGTAIPAQVDPSQLQRRFV